MASGKILGLGLFLLPFVQNCAPVGPSDSVGASLGAANLSSLSTTLTATFAPSTVSSGDTVIITPTGGVAPYRYILLTGQGTLHANIYTAGPAGDATLIEVIDATMSRADISFNVIDKNGTTPGTTPGPTPVPSPTATPAPPTPSTPSTRQSTTLPNGKALMRSCDMSQVSNLTGNHDYDINNGVGYEYCLILGRFQNNSEGYYYFHALKDGDISPQSIGPTLFSSPEFATHYGTLAMSNSEFMTFMARLVLFREPTVTELAQLSAAVGGATGPAAQQIIINAVTSSAAFQTANPFLVQLMSLYGS